MGDVLRFPQSNSWEDPDLVSFLKDYKKLLKSGKIKASVFCFMDNEDVAQWVRLGNFHNMLGLLARVQGRVQHELNETPEGDD